MFTVRWWDLAAIVVASVTVVLSLIDPPYGPPDWGTWATGGRCRRRAAGLTRRAAGLTRRAGSTGT